MTTQPSPLTPPIANKPNQRLNWGNLPGSALSLALAKATERSEHPLLVITTDNLTTNRLATELTFFLDNPKATPVKIVPDRETLPYDMFSPHQDIISERLLTLYQLGTLTRGIVLISIQTLMQYLPPAKFLMMNTFVQKQGDKIVIDAWRKLLAETGYRHVGQVFEHGEFAIRGSIIDLFPMGSGQPFRIDLFDDEIESIRVFDPETQRSLHTVPEIHLLPAREHPLTEESITLFRQQWRQHFSGNPTLSPVYQAISEGQSIAGIESYLPLFYEHMETLFDFLPKNTYIVKVADVHQAAEKFTQEIQTRYESRAYDTSHPLLTPKELYLATNEVFAAISKFSQIQISQAVITEGSGQINFDCLEPQNYPIARNSEKPLEALENFLQEQATATRVLFCVETAGRREALLNLLQSIRVMPKHYHNWQEFISDDAPIGIIIAPLEQGLQLIIPAIALIAEAQIFGLQVLQTRRQIKAKVQDSDSLVKNLLELTIGAPIVHIDHGIGRYVGLQTLKIADREAEFLTLEYAGNDKLYVPVSSLHLINRYTGPDSEIVPLNKLGTEQWSKAKRKAAEKIRDVAAELLALHAKRASKSGYVFKKDDVEYAKFASAFPFETTPDQERAINDVYDDMITGKSMDRLICGDVGFGKTEVAMRAAFLAAMNNKQVAVLVPTTLLAQQHYQSFSDRFADWPIRVGLLSRFVASQEQTKIINAIKENKYDVIIGTHKLLQKDIAFNNLGLLVIDEEHRFGVSQKEKMKSLRAEVDILNLTATPIPRTLNMAISGVRDLSIISTPPARRLSIKTFVHENNFELTREAILREILRGGQVYYLHNSVATIEKVARELAEKIPEIKVAIAHGQMRERELEKVMSDFYHHRFNVLVCTTIIESGIDIPTANTIIIDRADKFGLAQLHQLRGRVGRSHHQAYAYLFIPSRKTITADAIKRLDAIASLEDLGAGYMLATHDLEIRGAGEILGDEQSGHMQAIGFSLYMELLERAVDSLKSGKTLDIDDALHQETEIELPLPALIPESYMPDVHTRLILYKRIANAKAVTDLDELQVEMIDRFGLLPQQTKNLFAITELKLAAMAKGIRKVESGIKEGTIQFNEKPNIDPGNIINLIKSKPQSYKFDGPNRLRFYLSGLDDKGVSVSELITKVKMVLDEL